MGTLIHENLDIVIPTTHYWSDSKTVLCWLRSDSRRFQQFVANRVSEIEEKTDVNNWHWVPTKQNVADEGTRSNAVTEFQPKARWFTGPEFLLADEKDWPIETSKLVIEGFNEEELEIKRNYVNLICISTTSLPDVTRFSSWMRLIRTTALVIRCVQNCRDRALQRKLKKKISAKPTVWGLSVKELRQAENLWNRKCQRETFPEEVATMSTGKPVKSSRLNQLSPLMDSQGVLRIKGRLAGANDVEAGVKYPVILDPSHPYTKLLIDYHHLMGGHHGQERVVNELRQCYWILKMRTAVRSA